MDKKLENDSIIKYYELHSKFYDLSRWSFLFGRKALLNKILPFLDSNSKVIEIGCGTGQNLTWLEKNSDSNLFGLDISAQMLDKAKRKLSRTYLIEGEYCANSFSECEFDLIIMSYLVTLNKDYKDIIDNARRHLKAGGKIAVVDFYTANLAFYSRFMLSNHIYITEKIFDYLKENFSETSFVNRKAYFGIWNWGLFIGEKSD